jgi:hypothetical protein
VDFALIGSSISASPRVHGTSRRSLYRTSRRDSGKGLAVQSKGVIHGTTWQTHAQDLRRSQDFPETQARTAVLRDTFS